jgi:hypothetical protein
MAQGQKQYLVKWEIDITADSPREAVKLALEIQQDKTSEALAFDVYEKATNSETAVNLLDERTEGSDLDEAVKELEKINEMLEINQGVDFQHLIDFSVMYAKLTHWLIKDLVDTK